MFYCPRYKRNVHYQNECVNCSLFDECPYKIREGSVLGTALFIVTLIIIALTVSFIFF